MLIFALADTHEAVLAALEGAKRPPADRLPNEVRRLALVENGSRHTWRAGLSVAKADFWEVRHAGRCAMRSARARARAPREALRLARALDVERVGDERRRLGHPRKMRTPARVPAWRLSTIAGTQGRAVRALAFRRARMISAPGEDGPSMQDLFDRRAARPQASLP
jgi:hypothetical protein